MCLIKVIVTPKSSSQYFRQYSASPPHRNHQLDQIRGAVISKDKRLHHSPHTLTYKSTQRQLQCSGRCTKTQTFVLLLLSFNQLGLLICINLNNKLLSHQCKYVTANRAFPELYIATCLTFMHLKIMTLLTVKLTRKFLSVPVQHLSVDMSCYNDMRHNFKVHFHMYKAAYF